MDIFTLISLELNHLAHLRVIDDGAIAGKFLLDDLEDFLLVEFLGQLGAVSKNCRGKAAESCDLLFLNRRYEDRKW